VSSSAVYYFMVSQARMFSLKITKKDQFTLKTKELMIIKREDIILFLLEKF